MEETLTIEKTELPTLAANVLTRALALETPGAKVIALHGDLGAGKTTFVQTLGKALGVTETITSPTFTIMKAYPLTGETFTTLAHMDAYRIDDLNELGPLRFEALLSRPETLLVIEWAEKIASALPASILTLRFAILDETTRTVQISDQSVHSPGT